MTDAGQAAVLVVDDEIQIRRLLQITLEAEHYKVHLAASAEEGFQQAVMVRPDAVILDLGLPDWSGVDLLKRLREWSTIPVIILSVRSSETDIIGALDAGADDYLTKPFHSGELLARLRTALRHHQVTEQGNLFQCGSLTVDLSARVVKKNGDIIRLTPTEYALLTLFVRNAGKVLTHRYILEQVWGPSFVEETQYTRVNIGQLRKKIEDDPAHPVFIVTESGIGYRFSSLDAR